MRRRVLFAVLGLFMLCAALPDAPLRAGKIGEIGVDGFRETVLGSSSKVTLVNFWATWCAPCIQEVPSFVRLRDEYARDDLEIVGISLDHDAAAIPPFMRLMGVNYPVHLGTLELMEHLGVYAIPRTMLIRRGKLVYDHQGFLSFEDLDAIVDRFLE